jgi:hypothetical protein
MKNIILLLFVLAFTSCATFKANSLSENRQVLSKDNLKKFEGTFVGVSKDTLSIGLHYLVNGNSPQKESFAERYKTTLELIDKNHLKIELCRDTTIIQSSILKFRVRRDYLFIKKVVEVTSIVVMTGTGVRNTRIGLLENKNLIIDTVEMQISFFLVFPMADRKSKYYGLEFERIE